MLIFDKELVRNILMQELGYQEDKTERKITTLSGHHEDLQPLLDQWIQDRSISDHTINGVSLNMVYKYFEVNDFFSALIHMNSFAKHPGYAEQFLEDPYLIVGEM